MLYSDEDTRVEENRKDYLYLSNIYAHGLLENILEYDILMTNSIELYNDIYNWYHEGNKFIRQHKAEDSRGNIHDVNMYLWINKNTNRWQGLACLVDDNDAIEDAMKKYNEEEIML